MPIFYTIFAPPPNIFPILFFFGGGANAHFPIFYAYKYLINMIQHNPADKQNYCCCYCYHYFQCLFNWLDLGLQWGLWQALNSHDAILSPNWQH